jgi:Flp pilus assembly CpaE family ATPase
MLDVPQRMLADVNTTDVALVSRDQQERNALARAFDGAPPEWRVTFHDEPPAHADVVVCGSDMEVPDAIRFDRSEPGAIVAEVRRALQRNCGLVVVTSAIGGSGVTTLSLHLARSFVSAGSCVLLELDARGGIAHRLGIDGDPRTWAGSDGGDDLQLAGLPVAGGFRVLLAPRHAEAADAVTVMDAGARSFTHVVVDVPAGPVQVEALTRAHVAVVVVTPTLPAVRRTATLLDRVEPGLPCALVVNRLGPGGECSRIELRRVLGRAIATELPCCPALRDAEDRGALLSSPVYRWTRAVTRLSRALLAA